MCSLETPLPADKLPTCWDDDTRMNALFAPCKHISIAPEAWRQKMTFWSEQLRSWCRHRRSPLVSVGAARRAFTRNRNRPACLDVVIDEHIRNGEYVPISTYTGALNGSREGWVRWGARLAFKPAAIAVGLVTSYLPFDKTPHDGMATSSIDHDQLYVNAVVVKELATELLRSLPEDAERVGTLEELMETAGYEPAERQAFEVLLGYMMTAGLAIKKGDLYKLADGGASKVTPVTEAEEALHRLLAAERRILSDADKFRAEEERALADTRAALRLGNKALAKSHLRRKHRLSERAAGSEGALENVRRMLLELRQAEINTAIADTYRFSVGAMKKVMKDENLDEDTAHETMDELREVLDTYGEVEKSLAGKLDDYDAAELEDELEVLLASEPKDNATGGSPRQDATLDGVKTRKPKLSDREFVFDGEARMMAELNDLSLPDSAEPAARGERGEGGKVAVALAERDTDAARQVKSTKKKPEPPKATKQWYPPAENALAPQGDAEDGLPWAMKKIKNLEDMGTNYSLDALSNSMTELRTDPRLHPGQRLESNTSGRILYNTDFQVQDHRLNDGVWLYNANDESQRDDANQRDNSSRRDNNPSQGNNNSNQGNNNSNRGNDLNRRNDSSRYRMSSQDFANSTEYADLSGYDNRDFEMAPGGEREPNKGEWESNRGRRESARGTQESTRAQQESTRGQQESTRGQQESSRGEQESTRGDQESTRGEQKSSVSEYSNLDDLERRLRNLRSFK